MTNLLDYPFEPASGKTDTSAEAAEAIAPITGRLQRRALAAITAAPLGLTADELADVLGTTRPTIQPRTTELKLLGKIIDSGERRLNASGRRAIVWRAARHNGHTLPDVPADLMGDEERELLVSLFDAYADWRDVSNALAAHYSGGMIDGALVDAAFRANGREWQGWPV